jgi:hypothetical protein
MTLWADVHEYAVKLAKHAGLDEVCVKHGIPFERDVFHIKSMLTGEYRCGLDNASFDLLQRFLNHRWTWNAYVSSPFVLCPSCLERERILSAQSVLALLNE